MTNRCMASNAKASSLVLVPAWSRDAPHLATVVPSSNQRLDREEPVTPQSTTGPAHNDAVPTYMLLGKR
ncbi:MAG TPA: hypothetical protein VEL31_09850 [Ktedonobacteraceae bacterium]|nr:hypothetical protein [Ktedonobacteraceae bacterium]